MKNSIDAQIEFSFKGETYSLTSNIDLDQIMEYQHAFPSIHAILARDNKIDTFSYLFEVMLETGIRFANAQGNATDFISGGDLNQVAGRFTLPQKRASLSSRPNRVI